MAEEYNRTGPTYQEIHSCNVVADWLGFCSRTPVLGAALEITPGPSTLAERDRAKILAELSDARANASRIDTFLRPPVPRAKPVAEPPVLEKAFNEVREYGGRLLDTATRAASTTAEAGAEVAEGAGGLIGSAVSKGRELISDVTSVPGKIGVGLGVVLIGAGALLYLAKR